MTTNDDGESVITNLKNAIVSKVASLISTHNSDTNSHSDIRSSIPSPSTSNPLADTTSGSVGNSANYAKANHTHPKSDLYASMQVIYDEEDIIEDGIYFIENLPFLLFTITGNINLNSSFGYNGSNLAVKWGDETSGTYTSGALTHTYSDGQTEHTVKILGEITSLGHSCFRRCTGLKSIIIPENVTSIGNECFYYCTSLTSITIPESVTTFGSWCFDGCNNLVDYQLYWTDNNIVTYSNACIPKGTNAIFTIPSGQTANYVAKGYSSSKLRERVE